jgi:MFS family permease
MLTMMGGISMQMVVRGYLTYEITASPFKLGLVSAGFALPMLSLSVFGGAVADRMERKRVIQSGQALAGFLALFVAVSISTGTVTWIHLLVTSTAHGAVVAFLVPARQAIIPQLVGQKNLTNAFALAAAAMSATTLFTPSVAGGLYAAFGPDVVYYLIASLMVVSIVLTGLIRAEDGGPTKPSVPMLKDIGEGLSYIRSSPLVLILLLMGLLTALLAMPFRMGLMPIFIIDVYDRGPEALGLMVTVMGAGSLLGTMAIATMGAWHRGMLMIAGSFASAIGLLLVAVFPVYFAAVGIMLLLGLGDAGRRTLNQALIMEEVEDKYRGRVMGVFMMNQGLMPLGVLPAAAASEFIGPQGGRDTGGTANGSYRCDSAYTEAAARCELAAHTVIPGAGPTVVHPSQTHTRYPKVRVALVEVR